jgi:hypothetical protein
MGQRRIAHSSCAHIVTHGVKQINTSNVRSPIARRISRCAQTEENTHLLTRATKRPMPLICLGEMAKISTPLADRVRIVCAPAGAFQSVTTTWT